MQTVNKLNFNSKFIVNHNVIHIIYDHLTFVVVVFFLTLDTVGTCVFFYLIYFDCYAPQHQLNKPVSHSDSVF